MPDLEVTDLCVRFAGLAAPALDVPELKVSAGEMLAVVGPSGSGKSTLVNMLTGLDTPASGAICWGRTNIGNLSEAERDHWRGRNVGLVPQDFHLFPGLSAINNVLLPARLARIASRTIVDRAHDLLQAVGLMRPVQPVNTMSRGEMQRVAIARALLRQPAIVVADEPTASLDADNGAAVSSLLIQLAQQTGSTLIVVTHDEALIRLMPRHLVLRNGRISADRVAEGVLA